MNHSMQDYLKIVTPHLHPDLVSPEALSYIQSLAQILPPSSLAGFECRLGENQTGVDFQTRLPCLNQNLPERFLTAPAWQFLQDFYQDWTSPNSSLHQTIKNIGLEFDVNEHLPQVPIPCIFLQFNQEISTDAQSLIQIATRLLESISPQLESNLRLCADSLPAGATVSHLGAMLSRSFNAVRINVQGIPLEQLSDYLIRIGWTDSTNTFSTLVSTLSEFVDSVLLSFDVGDTLFPRIGLECFLKNQPNEELRWQSFLDYLVQDGLCTPAKKDAPLAWTGFSQKSSSPDLWPSNISLGDRFLGSRAFSIFWRKINHIKLVYQPGKPLEAKGYLAFGHDWYDRNKLIQEQQQETEKAKSMNSPITETANAATSQYLEQVRHYYDTMSPLIVKHVGKTYQAGLLKTNSDTDPACANNLYLAAQAGIQPGHHILDAGCGVCGPSVDIAQNVAGVKIDAITLSPVQAATAKNIVQQAGLENQISIHVGDYHHLPFADESFDVVCFFESSGYSYDRQQLFAEVHRVLRPGGRIYIKDVFCKESPLSSQQQQELEEFDRIYAQYKTPQFSETVEAISTVGFEAVESHDLSEIVSIESFVKAMFEYKHGFPFPSEFGKFHYRQFKDLPIFFGEVKARKRAV